jgi:hypothetical protein
LVQAEASADELVPPGQATQELWPLLAWKKPAVQKAQVVAPDAAENDPGVHATHEAWPVSGWSVPALHKVQLTDPVAEANDPAAQLVQVVA